MTAYAELVEQLAERQWQRMTRTSVPYDRLPEGDQRACRALVEPVIHDLIEVAGARMTDVTLSGEAFEIVAVTLSEVPER